MVNLKIWGKKEIKPKRVWKSHRNGEIRIEINGKYKSNNIINITTIAKIIRIINYGNRRNLNKFKIRLTYWN